jgi:streptogramin lyase
MHVKLFLAKTTVLLLMTVATWSCLTTLPKSAAEEGPTESEPSASAPHKAFEQPYDLAIDSRERIYVSDMGADCVWRMDDITGANLVAYGSRGFETGKFESPMSLCVDGEDRIYIVDQANGRIVRIDDMTGAGWTEFSPQAIVGSKFAPRGLYVDARGAVYVTDEYNNRILRVDGMDGANPILLGKLGTGEKRFAGPSALLVDDSGRIVVLDTENARIVRMGDMTGGGWAVFELASKEGRWQLPYAFCLDGHGGFYVSESHGARIQHAAAWLDGDSKSWAADGLKLEAPIFPIGIKLDASGRIYYVDQANALIARMDDMKGSGWISFPQIK